MAISLIHLTPQSWDEKPPHGKPRRLNLSNELWWKLSYAFSLRQHETKWNHLETSWKVCQILTECAWNFDVWNKCTLITVKSRIKTGDRQIWAVSRFHTKTGLALQTPSYPTPCVPSCSEMKETHLVELCGNYAIIKRGSLPKGFSHTPVSGGAVTTVGLGM